MLLTVPVSVPALPESPRRMRALGMFRGVLLLVGLFVLGSSASVALHSDPAAASESEAQTVHHHGAVTGIVAPGFATDGVLGITLPPGTAEVMATGGNGYLLPSVIKLAVGDRIVIRNDDVSTHIVLFAFVRPGETVERTLTEPGSETYSAGCAGMQTANRFTTIFVAP
jgi:hypothetical protein